MRALSIPCLCAVQEQNAKPKVRHRNRSGRGGSGSARHILARVFVLAQLCLICGCLTLPRVITSSTHKMFQSHGHGRVCSSSLHWFQTKFIPESGCCSNGLKWAFHVRLWIDAEWIGLSLFETHQTIGLGDLNLPVPIPVGMCWWFFNPGISCEF